jgi:CMP-N-acetylneuraminic acid synthetase
MINKDRILWLVAARSGSKSISDKNIKILGGIPLLAYRIKTVLTFAKKEDVWISTDSEHYAKIAESFGATVPFIRPKELSSDSVKSAEVVLHAVEWAESSDKRYDAVGLLEPTSPFLKPIQLIDAVNILFKEKEAENIVAVREVKPSSFYVQKEDKYLSVIADNIKAKGILRRQELEREITPSGGFYISKWETFKRNKTFYTEKTLAYLLPDINGLEIDEYIDLLWAEFLIEKKVISTMEFFTLK